MHCLGLVEKLLGLAPTAEINSQALRKALLEMLRMNPKLNRTKFNGETWASLRQERLVVVLNHFRRLGRDENKANALAKLTPVEYDALGKALAKLAVTEEESQGSQAPAELTVVEEALPKAASKRKLEATVSLDSEGYPRMLGSPDKPQALAKASNRLMSVARGQMARGSADPEPAAQEVLSEEPPSDNFSEDLRAMLGYEKSKKAMKKPSAAKKKEQALKKGSEDQPKEKQKKEKKEKKEKTKATKDKQDTEEDVNAKGPWTKLWVTRAKNPARIYITGLKEGWAKKKLIVEVTEARSPRYLEIGEKLMKEIKTKDLSKKDAVAMREKLVLKHPAALGPSS